MKYIIRDLSNNNIVVSNANPTICKLIADEEQAIDSYKTAIEQAETQEEKDLYIHILGEEEEHAKELKALFAKLNGKVFSSLDGGN